MKSEAGSWSKDSSAGDRFTERSQLRSPTCESNTERESQSIGGGLSPANVRGAYDAVADEYVLRISGELRGKPLDRELLEQFASRVRGRGPACELGCGPGHVARYVHDLGAEIWGIDLSPEMVARARQMHPEMEFQVGDMRSLDAGEGTWSGILSFYSILHFPREEVTAVLREMLRTLQPGGALLIAFHLGEGSLHMDEFFGIPVCIDFLFFQTGEVVGYLEDAGFRIENILERDPYPDVEHPSRRAYIWATKPFPG
jgi:SAM-dependent methyltransferase